MKILASMLLVGSVRQCAGEFSYRVLLLAAMDIG